MQAAMAPDANRWAGAGRLAGARSTSIGSRSALSLSDCLHSESAAVDGRGVWHDGCPNVWS